MSLVKSSEMCAFLKKAEIGLEVVLTAEVFETADYKDKVIYHLASGLQARVKEARKKLGC